MKKPIKKLAPTITKQKVKPGGKRIQYTEQDKADILACYIANNYAISLTAREAGIPKSTLHKWVNEAQQNPNSIISKEREVQKIVERTKEEVSIHHPDFMGKVYNAKDMALDRIMKLIPTSRSLQDLAGVLKQLAELTGDKPQPQIKNFFTQINNTLKQKGYGTDTDND